jgi:LysM repeat protein
MKEEKSFERYHDVDHQENLFTIAQKYQLPVEEIVKANPQTIRQPQVGEKYLVFVKGKISEQFAKAGQNLWTIARDNNISIKDLLKENPNFVVKLKYGDQINLPEVTDLNKADKMILGEDMAKVGASESALINSSNFEDLISKEGKEVVDSNAIIEELSEEDNHIRCGISIKRLKEIYGKKLVDRSYTDKKGNHIVYWLMNERRDQSLDLDIRFFADCEDSQDCIVRKVVVEDDDYLFDKGIHVKSTMRDIKERFSNPVVEVLANSLVVFPDKKSRICCVMEAFSIQWRENGEYTVKDIPDEVEVVSIHLF